MAPPDRAATRRAHRRYPRPSEAAMADEQDKAAMADDPHRDDRKAPRPEPPRDGTPDDLEGKSPEEIAAELRRVREALKKTKDDARRNQLRKEELEAAEAERERANLSETEKQKREREEALRKAREAEDRASRAEQRLINLQIDRDIERIAIAMEFEYPDTVPQLVDRSRVEYDPETGKVVGAKEAVERLAKDRPKLLRARPSGGSPNHLDGPRRSLAPASLTRPGRPVDPAVEELYLTGRAGGKM